MYMIYICIFTDSEEREQTVISEIYSVTRKRHPNIQVHNDTLQLDEISQNFPNDGFSAKSESSSNGCKSKNGYVCTTCGEKLKSNCKLQSHIKKHLGNRRFVCVTCDKGFRDNYTYQVHIRIHTREDKLFKCTVCNKRFHDNKSLQGHQQRTHETMHYSCSYCRRTFIQIKHL